MQNLAHYAVEALSKKSESVQKTIGKKNIQKVVCFPLFHFGLNKRRQRVLLHWD